MDFDFSVATEGLERVLKLLPEETAKKVTRRAVAAGARVIRDGAKELAPYDDGRSTGTHLKDALVVKRLQGTNDIFRIGTLTGRSPKGAPHAHLIEFGTIKMQPLPFLRPASIFLQEKAVGKILKIMSNGILRESIKLAGR